MMKHLKLVLALAICTIQVFVAGQQFSVLTWNVLGAGAPDLESYRHSGSKFSFDSKRFSRFDAAAEMLENFSADVVCLQECALSLTGDPKNSKADRAFKKGPKFNYDLVSYAPKGSAGVALFVRGGSGLQPVVLADGTKVCGDIAAAKPGACAWALFKAKNEKVLVASVHIARANNASGGSDGHTQWNVIVDKIKTIIAQSQPCSVVFAGDLNTFYQEVLSVTRAYLTKILGASIEMYQHNSWTANGNKNFDFNYKNIDLSGRGKSEDFDFCSIDHVLYTSGSLKIDENKSFVGSQKNFYKDNQVATAITKVSYDKLTTQSKVDLIHTVVPSDHLPVFVKFDFTNQGGAASAANTATGKTTSPGQAAATSFDVETWFKNHEQEIRGRILNIMRGAEGSSISASKTNLANWFDAHTDRSVFEKDHADLDKVVKWINGLIKEMESKPATASTSSSAALIQALELASCLK